MCRLAGGSGAGASASGSGTGAVALAVAATAARILLASSCPRAAHACAAASSRKAACTRLTMLAGTPMSFDCHCLAGRQAARLVPAGMLMPAGMPWATAMPSMAASALQSDPLDPPGRTVAGGGPDGDGTALCDGTAPCASGAGTAPCHGTAPFAIGATKRKTLSPLLPPVPPPPPPRPSSVSCTKRLMSIGIWQAGQRFQQVWIMVCSRTKAQAVPATLSGSFQSQNQGCKNVCCMLYALHSHMLMSCRACHLHHPLLMSVSVCACLCLSVCLCLSLCLSNMERPTPPTCTCRVTRAKQMHTWSDHRRPHA